MKIVLYSNGSLVCEEVREFLKARSLEFEEVDVRTSEGFNRLLRRTQQNTVPAVEFKRSHSVGVIVGRNWGAFERVLGGA